MDCRETLSELSCSSSSASLPSTASTDSSLGSRDSKFERVLKQFQTFSLEPAPIQTTPPSSKKLANVVKELKQLLTPSKDTATKENHAVKPVDVPTKKGFDVPKSGSHVLPPFATLLA